jgi:hypothetical protein
MRVLDVLGLPLRHRGARRLGALLAAVASLVLVPMPTGASGKLTFFINAQSNYAACATVYNTAGEVMTVSFTAFGAETGTSPTITGTIHDTRIGSGTSVFLCTGPGFPAFNGAVEYVLAFTAIHGSTASFAYSCATAEGTFVCPGPNGESNLITP